MGLPWVASGLWLSCAPAAVTAGVPHPPVASSTPRVVLASTDPNPAATPAPSTLPAPQCALRWTVRSIPTKPNIVYSRVTPEGVVWLVTLPSSLIVSTDGGANYTKVEIPFKKIFDAEYVRMKLDESSPRDVWAKDRDLYVVTSYQVFVGRDLGKHWSRLLSPKMEMVQSPNFPSPVEGIWADAKRVYFIGNRGVVNQSQNNGKTWSQDTHARNEYRYAFLHLTGNDDGQRYISDGGGRLLRTANDGADWAVIEPNEPGVAFYGLPMVGPGGNALA
jgi:hypothetical protein